MEKFAKLKKNEELNILRGYQWIFSNEIAKVEGDPENGDIIKILKNNNEFLGFGFYNKNSLIAIRFLTGKEVIPDVTFFKERILSADSLRRKIYPEQNVYRMVNSESDFLPGLIIDRYNEGISIQTYSAGMDRIINDLVKILIELFSPLFIIEKNESQLRKLEGIELRTSVLYGNPIPLKITIDGIIYSIDLLSGQKTGFFLDQRENRVLIRKYSKDRRVLDCFCNEGGFSLNAAFAGAKEVIGIDISDFSIQKCRENSSLNNLNNICRFEINDSFDILEKYASENNFFDLVILDPPSFTKSKKNIPAAVKAYKRINTLAMKIIQDNGFLISASCSHHIKEEDFLKIISECATKERCKIKMIEFRSAAPDHLILPNMPETKYLKFGIFQVVK